MRRGEENNNNKTDFVATAATTRIKKVQFAVL
jgi:hypothetical protein